MMISRQVNSKKLQEIRLVLKSHLGTITELAHELGVGQPAISIWLSRGYGLSADKQIRIGQRAAELSGNQALNISADEVSQPTKNPEYDPRKRKAYVAVRRAIEQGKLTKPNVCGSCGTESSSKTLHAHHSDYSKPLDVVWLCEACHWILHNNERLKKARKTSIVVKREARSRLVFQQYLQSRSKTTRQVDINSSFTEEPQKASAFHPKD